MSGTDSTHNLETLITEAKASGGSEMANCHIFVERLCAALDMPKPNMASEENQYNDYVFERRIDFKHPDGSSTRGRIDCYKRNSFVLEAKQSASRQAKVNKSQLSLLTEDERQTKSGQAKRGTRGWDQVMLAARKQAEDYAKALPTEHGYPPFLLIVDIGNVIEVYADFSGLGKNYAQFPDRLSYRISMDDLREPHVQARLKAIWSDDPHQLNPAKRSAEVTSDIAARLAKIAKSLEGKHDAKDVAEFLMRCLFTMFAEDVELIPKKYFETMLGALKDKPDEFVPALESLWKTMDKGEFENRTFTKLREFNGGLFAKRTALPLEADQIHELYAASQRTWQEVEPAIFGTLLERALDSRERSKLGAHYTPRAYVERLVIPTILEPLRADWDEVKTQVEDQRQAGKMDDALQTLKTFHHKLCTTRVLDPACGTGNFLYVALEMMKVLEGEVLDALDAFGEKQSSLVMEGETVSPRQFYGLELNPRAVPVADLVLWIGYLKWQLKTTGLASISEPVLHAYGTIRHQDAVIAYDKQELLRDENGKPLSRWDGVTKKLHPITGEEIPDPDAKLPLYTYVNPRIAPWPEVEFIVGNPPFIGNKRMRIRLGSEYVDAVRKVHVDTPDSVDFVMYWWKNIAQLCAKKKVRAAGLVTTNSITQTLNRQVLQKYIGAEKTPISIFFAIPNHPWIDSADAAAVRVAFTVITPGYSAGIIEKVISEKPIEHGEYRIETTRSSGFVSSGLRIGAAVTTSLPLLGNSELAFQGIISVGKGFRLRPDELRNYSEIENERYIKPYKIGSDILYGWDEKYIIDVNSLQLKELAVSVPSIYQHLLNRVKPERDENNDKKFRDEWWRWGRRRDEMFESIEPLTRYIVTCRTATHRLFSFEKSNLVPDAKIVAIADDQASSLALLSSRTHLLWSEIWARLGVGDDSNYNHSECFGRYPSPYYLTDASNPALRQRLYDLGERLDAFRKDRLAAHDFLTMTAMYNVLERVRELENEAPPSPRILRGEGAPLGADEGQRQGSEDVLPHATGAEPTKIGAAPHPSLRATLSPPLAGRREEATVAAPHPSLGDTFSPQTAERREVPPLTPTERDIYDAGLISILKEIHDDIDRATFEAYGWQDLGAILVGKPGATMPSAHKSEAQEQAEEELLTRLVALNLERQEEEKRGLVRWLRPDYQIPKLGAKVVKPSGEEQLEADVGVITLEAKPKWPSDVYEQIRIIRLELAKAPAPASQDEIALAFDGRNTPARKQRVAQALETLVSTGAVRLTEESGSARYFVPR